MDVWWWRRTSSGIFDTQSFYCALSLTSQVEPFPFFLISKIRSFIAE
jgi:hypothetical protein